MSMATDYALRLKAMISGPLLAPDDFLVIINEIGEAAVNVQLGPPTVWIFADGSMLKEIDGGGFAFECAEWQGD